MLKVCVTVLGSFIIFGVGEIVFFVVVPLLVLDFLLQFPIIYQELYANSLL